MADAPQTALLLNANAKRVTARRIRQLAGLCPPQDVYLSHSMEEAEAMARTIVERGYARVLAGGGDGTLVQVVNTICRLVEESQSSGKTDSAYPEIGILKLGTGNAVAGILDAARPEADLPALMRDPSLPLVPLELIHSEEDGLDFPFAGVGYDGEVLNDYLWVKQHMKGPVVEEVTHTLLGYFLAIFSRTVPRKLTEKEPARVRITTRGRAFLRDASRGDEPREIPAGSLLYDGPAAMVAVSTVPYYGFNMKVFPFALDYPGMMQLRVVSASPWTILRNLPAIWRGDYRDPDMLDFHVEDVVVEGEQELPFQIAGDAKGYRKRLAFSMSPRRVDLVCPRAVTIPVTRQLAGHHEPLRPPQPAHVAQ